MMRADKLFHKPSFTRLPKLKFEENKKDDPLEMAESPEEMKPEKFKIHILDKFEGFRKFNIPDNLWAIIYHPSKNINPHEMIISPPKHELYSR